MATHGPRPPRPPGFPLPDSLLLADDPIQGLLPSAWIANSFQPEDFKTLPPTQEVIHQIDKLLPACEDSLVIHVGNPILRAYPQTDQLLSIISLLNQYRTDTVRRERLRAVLPPAIDPGQWTYPIKWCSMYEEFLEEVEATSTSHEFSRRYNLRSSARFRLYVGQPPPGTRARPDDEPSSAGDLPSGIRLYVGKWPPVNLVASMQRVDALELEYPESPVPV
ncbi:hypothetical protein NMY22_g800 [Coprinellus aureogranulatus]|nr:hypothetical protein NMY22_g800 [Coprinellus aureogranulatus]